jgi:hypothetical protein
MRMIGNVRALYDQRPFMVDPPVQSTAASPGVFIAGTYARAAKPTASVGWLGKAIRLHDTGQPDEVHLCEQTSSGGYEWTAFALASS